MKTSIKLLILTACVALTGLVSVNALLKKEYDRIDWSNPYQNFIREAIPPLRHVRVIGYPTAQVLVRQDPTPSIMADPNISRALWQTSQRGDTLLLDFSTTGFTPISPVQEIWSNWATNQAEIVLNLPRLASLDVSHTQIVLDEFLSENLNLTSNHALLHTKRLRIPGTLTVRAENGAIIQLNADSCRVLSLFVQDSSRVQLGNIRPTSIRPVLEPRAELWLSGNQLAKTKTE
jgi:hypothetical protein